MPWNDKLPPGGRGQGYVTHNLNFRSLVTFGIGEASLFACVTLC